VRVLYQIWDQPIYTIGGKHMITDALALCGATNVFAELTTAAPAVTREAAVLRDPDGCGARTPPGQLCGRAHRPHGALGDPGDRQFVRGHRPGPKRANAGYALIALEQRESRRFFRRDPALRKSH
jgi:hypothetical protein